MVCMRFFIFVAVALVLSFCFVECAEFINSNELENQLEAIHAEIRLLRAQGLAQQSELQMVRLEQQGLREQMARCGCSATGEIQEDSDMDGDVESSSQDVGVEDSLVVSVDVRDETWVKEVLFGGKPWVVHCLDRRADVKQEVPDVFPEASRALKDTATFGTLHCWERLASSGKTLAQRFNFPKPPITFAVANGDPPLILNMYGVVKPRQIMQLAGMYLTVQVTEVDGLARFKALCSKRRACLVVSFQTLENRVAAVEVLRPLLEEHRGVRAVALDARAWRLRLDKRLADKRSISGTKRADLLYLSRGEGTRRWGAYFRSGDKLEPSVIAKFLERCAEGKDLTPITETPWISHYKKGSRSEL